MDILAKFSYFQCLIVPSIKPQHHTISTLIFIQQAFSNLELIFFCYLRQHIYSPHHLIPRGSGRTIPLRILQTTRVYKRSAISFTLHSNFIQLSRTYFYCLAEPCSSQSLLTSPSPLSGSGIHQRQDHCSLEKTAIQSIVMYKISYTVLAYSNRCI